MRQRVTTPKGFNCQGVVIHAQQDLTGVDATLSITSVPHLAEIVHGKMGRINHTGKGLFAGLPNPFQATRYHSLTVERETLPDCLEITAELDDGTIMGLQHRELPMHGVQFHPESIRSEHGHAMLDNFLKTMKVPA